MRYPPQQWKPCVPARPQGAKLDFKLIFGQEEPIRIRPTRRGTTLLVTAGVALILAAAIIELVL